MTYHKPVPDHVFSRWRNLNPNYEIDFSLDDDCINFLKNNFNEYIVNLFITIKEGMIKADLWRLCKLYINGGIYADVDLVPYLNIDTLNKDITFYSCIDISDSRIFQALMIISKPKNPLILVFLLSFLINTPYIDITKPTKDMYDNIKYNLNNQKFLPETKYDIDEVKIKINIGSSDNKIKNINLYYFPENIEYTIKLLENPQNDMFNFEIKNNTLTVTNINNDNGWSHSHFIDICFKSKESIFLFKENIGENNNWIQSYVTFNNQKILDSRDLDYYFKRGW
jgi:hypothetical protein